MNMEKNKQYKYSVVNYADITTNDRNPVKRWLQNRRLAHGLRLLRDLQSDFKGRVLDYGAGNGELARRLSQKFPRAEFVCFEPSAGYHEQVVDNISGCPNVRAANRINELEIHSFDIVFCLEVLEHLPERETREVFDNMSRLLKAGGRLIIGVPNEIYLAGLVKGIFRMTRRYGDYDARIGNILKSAFGRPPLDRPVAELDRGLRYIFRHTGFDYRRLQRMLAADFDITEIYGSPLSGWPLFFNSEVYFMCRNTAARDGQT